MSESAEKRARTLVEPSFDERVTALRRLLAGKNNVDAANILFAAYKEHLSDERYASRLVYHASRVFAHPIPYRFTTFSNARNHLLYLDMNMDISPLLRQPIVTVNTVDAITRLETIIDTFGIGSNMIRVPAVYDLLCYSMKAQLVCTMLCLRKRGGWRMNRDLQTKIASMCVIENARWVLYSGHGDPARQLAHADSLRNNDERIMHRFWITGRISSVRNMLHSLLRFQKLPYVLTPDKNDTAMTVQHNKDDLILKILCTGVGAEDVLQELARIVEPEMTVMRLLSLISKDRNRFGLSHIGSMIRSIVRRRYRETTHEDRIRLSKAYHAISWAQIPLRKFPLMCGPILGNGRWDIRHKQVDEVALNQWRGDWFCLTRNSLWNTTTFDFQEQVIALTKVMYMQSNGAHARFYDHALFKIIRWLGALYGKEYGPGNPLMQIYP